MATENGYTHVIIRVFQNNTNRKEKNKIENTIERRESATAGKTTTHDVIEPVAPGT